MRQRVVYFVMIWVAVTSVSAQEAKKWTLDDCIDYALEKNIQLQQDKISLEESSVDVKTAKAALFPSLSFSTGQNVTNRPYQETSNTVSGTEIISSDSKTTYNGNYGLNAQWTLWNGNKRLNAIKQKKTSQQIAGLTVAETENSLQEYMKDAHLLSSSLNSEMKFWPLTSGLFLFCQACFSSHTANGSVSAASISC